MSIPIPTPPYPYMIMINEDQRAFITAAIKAYTAMPHSDKWFDENDCHSIELLTECFEDLPAQEADARSKGITGLLHGFCL